MPNPAVVSIGTVSSVLDYVRDERIRDAMAPFDSVIAKAQTKGRGEHGHSWVSPEGNVYAAMRLPLEGHFRGTEAAVYAAGLFAEALSEEGYPVSVKWPNDLVLELDGAPKKICGILLEERGGMLFAGIGIDVASSPEAASMREGCALFAGNLRRAAAVLGLEPPSAESLWRRLVKRVASIYIEDAGQKLDWRRSVQSRLLWLGVNIEIEDSDGRFCGVFKGLGSKGELILEGSCGQRCFLSGSIRVRG